MAVGQRASRPETELGPQIAGRRERQPRTQAAQAIDHRIGSAVLTGHGDQLFGRCWKVGQRHVLADLGPELASGGVGVVGSDLGRSGGFRVGYQFGIAAGDCGVIG